MTIKELKEIMIKLNKKTLICFNTEPIKLPNKLHDCWNDKDITVNEINESRGETLVENGYLRKGTQCQIIGNDVLDLYIDKLKEVGVDSLPSPYIFNSNEVALNFFAIECIIDIEDDVFDLWDFHLDELDKLNKEKH